MPHWFFFAVAGPLIWSIIHHVDKFILTKFSSQNPVGSLILFSALFPGVTLPIFLLIGTKPLSISGNEIFVLIMSGIISAIALLFYFYALEEEETSVIVPMFQLMPIFAYFLGIVVLGESIETVKILAGLIIIFGASILSFELEEDSGLRFRLKPTLFMVVASMLLALNDVVFKSAAILNGSYKISIFWNFAGYFIFGLILFGLVKNYRKEFIATLKTHKKKYISLNIFNESMQTLANLSFSYAILLAPVALVLTVEAYHPLFVFIIGIILTKFFPKIATEKIAWKHLLHKAFAIAIIVIGSIFVYH